MSSHAYWTISIIQMKTSLINCTSQWNKQLENTERNTWWKTTQMELKIHKSRDFSQPARETEEQAKICVFTSSRAERIDSLRLRMTERDRCRKQWQVYFRSLRSWLHLVRRAGKRTGYMGFLPGRKQVWPEDSGFPARAAWSDGPCRLLWASETGRRRAPVQIRASRNSGIESQDPCWTGELKTHRPLCLCPESLCGERLDKYYKMKITETMWSWFYT